MAFAESMQLVAIKLLTKYGNIVDIEVTTAGNYNPSSGEVDSTIVTHTTKAYIGNFTMAELPQDNVNAHDMKVILSYKDNVTKDDTLMIHGKQYQIINIISVVTQDQLIIQTLQARAIG